MPFRSISAVVIGLLSAVPAFPWWETGHRVVARVAAAHLTAAARTRVAHILNVPDATDAVADALAQASTWADETKAQTGTGAWHFIDLAIQDHQGDISARCPNDNCAPARIRIFAAALKTPGTNAAANDLDALRYIVHFVGDIHQPLHTISDADLGGNCELLDPVIDQAKNVHALWDGPLVTEMGSEADLTKDIASEIEKLSPEAQRGMAGRDVNDWVWESHELAIRDVYQQLRIPIEPVEFPASCAVAPDEIKQCRPTVTPSYIAAMKPVVRLQLERAGLRLAELLNGSL